jgi:two-component system, OmpR family, response regulator ChvI
MTDISTSDPHRFATEDFELPLVAADGQPRARIVVVDDDDLVRDVLEWTLTDAEFEVRSFSSGAAALSHLLRSKDDDIVLLDWKMPGMDGIEVLHRMRQAGIMVPVVFLTAMTDQTCEEVALRDGAVDFVEKARGFSILLHRVSLILDGVKTTPSVAAASDDEAVFHFGDLQLKRDAGRALWKGQEVPLSFNEFRMLDLLAAQPGRHVPYRTLYDLVRGPGFLSGYGPEGFRSNVRTFIKRIRAKFRMIDEEWDLIENYSGFGYRWRGWGGEAEEHHAANQDIAAYPAGQQPRLASSDS